MLLLLLLCPPRFPLRCQQEESQVGVTGWPSLQPHPVTTTLLLPAVVWAHPLPLLLLLLGVCRPV